MQDVAACLDSSILVHSWLVEWLVGFHVVENFGLKNLSKGALLET